MEDMDKLERIFELQKTYIESSKFPRYPETLEDRISALCTAIIHEAAELQRLGNYKWWKTPVKLDKAKAREELIDIWHFVVQASIELEMEPKDILDEYQKKNLVNRRRQTNGY